jgi:FkbM family methyltransferase
MTHISWAIEIFQRYGLRTLLRLTRFVLTQRKGTISSVHIPGFVRPLWLRGKSSDIHVLFQVLVRQEYDCSRFPQHTEILRRYHARIRNGQTPLILDCGANIGLSTLWFAKQFPEARILAIEPSPDNAAMIRKNCEGYDNIEVIEGGVWDTPGTLAIANPSEPSWAHRVMPAASGVAAYTIEQLTGGGAAFIVKIDVEGSEGALFRSNTEWVDRTDLVMVECHDWLFPGSKTSNAILRRLTSADFELLLNGENMMFLLSDAAVMEATAPKVASPIAAAI